MNNNLLKHRVLFISVAVLILFSVMETTGITQSLNLDDRPRNVIFIHPDGASIAHYAAARMLYYGADSLLFWDKLDNVAVCKGHILDNLQSGSTSGAVAHASGVKTHFEYYGLDPKRNPLSTILKEAKQAGFSVGLINSGSITEPGTGVFAASVQNRNQHDEIAAQIIEAGVDVIFGGGEKWFLPQDVIGRYGQGERKDSVNLIEQARISGYTIVHTREQLFEIGDSVSKLLGLFASNHTFNARTEEYLNQQALPFYWNYSPTLSEMIETAIQILSRNPKGFLLIVEEEGSDNFANSNNAAGTLLAVKRADDAMGTALRFARKNTGTLLITSSDSNAGGLEIWSPNPDVVTKDYRLPEKRKKGSGLLDGANGTGGVPFFTPDERPFGIAWSGYEDFASNTIARAFGAYSHLVSGTIDNTDIYHIMREALGLSIKPQGTEMQKAGERN